MLITIHITVFKWNVISPWDPDLWKHSNYSRAPVMWGIHRRESCFCSNILNILISSTEMLCTAWIHNLLLYIYVSSCNGMDQWSHTRYFCLTDILPSCTHSFQRKLNQWGNEVINIYFTDGPVLLRSLLLSLRETERLNVSCWELSCPWWGLSYYY